MALSGPAPLMARAELARRLLGSHLLVSRQSQSKIMSTGGRHMTKQRGFTLIELMIVVAIIAILAAIAVSQYQDYLIRAQVSEGSALADGNKTAIAEFVNNYGRFSAGGNTSYGVAKAESIVGKYVSQVDLGATPGQIHVTFSSSAPQTANAAIDTRCSCIRRSPMAAA